MKEKLLLFFKIGILSLVFITVFSILAAMGIFLHFSKNLPKIMTIDEYKPKVVTTVYDDKDKLIGEFYREKRTVVPYSKIPGVVVQAFISSEDNEFFHHKGVDFKGIMRAMLINFRAGRFVQGGSTITQQVAKSLLLSSEKKLSRKIKEAILAFRIEKNLSKEQILFLYLNQIYLGHSAYGIQEAAKAYFNKNVEELSLAEASLLAGLPQAPSKWSPLSNPDKAKERQIYVLGRMVKEGYITRNEAEEAINTRLKIEKNLDFNLKQAPYFTEFVRRYLNEKYGIDRVLDEGLKVYTTIDIDLQKAAQEAIKAGLRSIDRRQGYKGPIGFIENKESFDMEIKKIHKEIYNESRDYVYFPEPGYQFQINTSDFVSNINDDLEKNAKDIWEIPTPLYKDKFYKAVVLNVDDVNEEITVSVGNLEGIITKEYYQWGHLRALSSQDYSWYKVLDKPSDILKKYDLVLVSLQDEIKNDKDKNAKVKLIFSLEQEPELESSLLSIDIATGSIKAMVGGYSYVRSEFNRAYQSKRQAGSTFKPLIYAAAIDKGYTPASVIVDSPIVFSEDEADNKWKPQNYSEKFYGDTILRDALIYSRNIPSTKILQDIKIPYAIKYVSNLGIKSAMQEDLSLALGSASVSLWEMVKAFSVFPAGGKRVTPIFIKRVLDEKNNILEEQAPDNVKDFVLGDDVIDEDFKAIVNKPASAPEDFDIENFKNSLEPGTIISKDTAYIMTYLLKEVVQMGTGREASSLGRPIGAKTGTTNDFIDAWFIGFTPQLSTGVWVGFDDNTKTLGKGETGNSAAIPIWLKYMTEAVKGFDPIDFKQVSSVKLLKIDAETGKVASKYSKKVTYLPFKEGTEPKEVEGETKIDNLDETEFFREDF